MYQRGVHGFGARLKAARKKLGLSQTEFGKMVGYSQSAIVYYETEQRTASVDFLYAVCNRFGMSPMYLLGLEK